MARLRHPRPWRAYGPPHAGRRRVRHRRSVDVDHARMRSARSTAMCGCGRHGVVPTVSRRRATPPTMRSVGWFEKKSAPPTNGVLGLGFGGFPTRSLWKTQVRGNELCEGIVGVTARLASNCHTIFWILACHGVSRARTRLTLPKPNKCSM